VSTRFERSNACSIALGDRIVMTAATIVLEPVFEADFSPVSFGFRPTRNTGGAHRYDRLDPGRRPFPSCVLASVPRYTAIVGV
jgi:hypothetical protein